MTDSGRKSVREKDGLYRHIEEGKGRGIESRCKHDQSAPN